MPPYLLPAFLFCVGIIHEVIGFILGIPFVFVTGICMMGVATLSAIAVAMIRFLNPERNKL